MKVRKVFIGDDSNPRSGWRLMFFVAAFLLCAKLFGAAGGFVMALTGARTGIWATAGPFLVGAMVLLSSATLVGWGCGALLEGLPFRSLGWWPHQGWLKNAALGTLIGAASLLLAVSITAATRGITFSLSPAPATTIARTAIVTLVVFVVAGAAEEALFRGYPLQTLARARLAWLGIVLTSVPFALGHLTNPNVSRGFTFVNTTLAGIWFAVAYLRTQSLWFPFGLHWSWNWMQALLGIPVSGIDVARIAPAPVLQAMNAGPDWLTGGRYGIEGGAACTVALIVSTIVVWRTSFVATAEGSAQSSNRVTSKTSAH